MHETWWKEAVVYQIYPKSFMDSNGDGIGDIPGIISKLDYLKELGITVLWICPLYRSPQKDNGYDISDYQAIHEDFGSMEDFDALLAGAHERGIKIVMDLVVNHTSDQHKWFLESKSSRDNKYRDYYIWRDAKDGSVPTNWGGCFGGSAWQYDEATDQYYLHQFAVEQPDLNWENPAVRREVFDMMNWWCEKGIDGFRMDVISLISKPEIYENGPVNTNDGYSAVGGITANGHRVHEFLKEMNSEVLSRYDLLTVGECAGVTVDEAKKYAGANTNELNMVFQFEHMDLDGDEHGKWTKKPLYLPDLKENFTKWQTELEGKAWNSLYWDNHDQPRIVSRWGNDNEKYRVISAKMLGTCLHMMQGTPYIYQGEELGMTNFPFRHISQVDDIECKNAYQTLVIDNKEYSEETMFEIISKKSRDNARTPMQWDDSENGGFTTGTPWLAVNPNYTFINAASQVNDPDSVFSYYKKLIELRKNNKIIVYGSYDLLCPDDEKIYAFTRTLGDEKLLVICNFTDETLEIPEDAAALKKAAKAVMISNYSEASDTLRPYEAVVYSC
ncbi:MAG: alpha-glucosidase [Blautia sp.]|nr:alpha-glucosidase [Blautia sp.]